MASKDTSVGIVMVHEATHLSTGIAMDCLQVVSPQLPPRNTSQKVGGASAGGAWTGDHI